MSRYISIPDEIGRLVSFFRIASPPAVAEQTAHHGRSSAPRLKLYIDEVKSINKWRCQLRMFELRIIKNMGNFFEIFPI